MRPRCATVVLTALLAAAPAHAAEPIRIEAGTPVAEALDELRGRGARIVYSSALVPYSLRVARTVSGSDALDLARNILAPHGLELRALGASVFGVVAARDGARGLLAGRVLDAGDGHPIRGARVEALDSGFIGWSDENGAFTLRLRGRGRGALRVGADGYRAQVVEQSAAADGLTVVRLEPAPIDIEQVTVVASRFTYEDPIAASAFLLDQADIVAQPKVGEDALQSIARLPGVAFSGVSARPNVRGGEKTETLVVLDRMPLREAFHLPSYNSAFSVIDESLVARLDAYTGPQPARFGNRLGALIELESVGAANAPASLVGLSTFNARARTAGPQRDEHRPMWLAAGRVGTVRAWLDDYAPDVGRPTYGDVFAKLRRTNENGAGWQLAGLWSGSELEFFDPDTTERAELTSRAAYLWLTADRPLGDATLLRALLGYSHIDSDRHGTLAGGLTPQGELADTRSSRIFDASFRVTWQPTGRHTIEAGLAATAGHARYRYTSEVEFDAIAGTLFGVSESRERTSDLDLNRSSVSAFVSDRAQLAQDWFFEAGLRFDRDLEGPRRKRGYLSPRLALRWDAGPRTAWRMSYGRALQSDDVQELRVEDGVASFEEAQRADQFVLSVDRRIAASGMLRIEGFDRRVRNPRTRYENLLDPLRFMPELSPDRVAVSPSSARLRGIEASAQWELGEWSIWGAYTRAEAFDEIDGQQIARDWDQRHTLALALTWRHGAWIASALGSWHSGRPTTKIVDASLAAPRLGARNFARLPGAATLDLRVSREFRLKRGRLIAYLQVTNVLDRDNRCCTEIDLPDEDADAATLETEPIYSYPALPALGVQWEY